MPESSVKAYFRLKPGIQLSALTLELLGKKAAVRIKSGISFNDSKGKALAVAGPIFLALEEQGLLDFYLQRNAKVLSLFEPKKAVPFLKFLKAKTFSEKEPLKRLNPSARIESTSVRGAELHWKVTVPFSSGILRFSELEELRLSVPKAWNKMLEVAGFVGSRETSKFRKYWDPEDWSFHAHTSDPIMGPIGANYRFGPISKGPKAIRKPLGGKRISLPQVRYEKIRSRPFSALMASRRSTRNFSEKPLSLEKLSELLFRVGHNFSRTPKQSKRLYPSGGGLYEHEFYLAVKRCQGLSPGFYRYDTAKHFLESVPLSGEKLEAWFTQAMTLWGKQYPPPPIVLVLSTRLPRMSYKYMRIAYRTSLINMGCLYQTTYLVAEDMGLGCCAFGKIDPRLFEETTGIDPFEETALGQMALGPLIPSRVRKSTIE